MRTRTRGRRILTVTATALAIVVAVTGCSSDETLSIDVPAQVDAALPDDTVAELQSAVEYAMAATGSPGALVGVWAPWSGEWVTGLGVADIASGAEADASMTFRAADITRAMTCDVYYDLVAAETVAADDLASERTSIAAGLEEVTLEQLCEGTSGLGSYESELFGMWIQNPARQWEPNELASYGIALRTDAEPGARWDGSDAGYVLLGVAEETATRQTASELFAEHVFEPLGMSASSLPSASRTTPGSDPLSGYLSRRGEDGLNCAEPLDVTEISPSIGFTDSGVVTDIADLGRYAQALAVGTLAPEGVDRFASPLPVEGAPSWFTAGGGAYQAGSLIGSYGSVPGYITAAFADPDTGMAVAVVLNNSAAGADVGASLAFQLAAIASKAPAAEGQTAPAAGLPWTAEQYREAIGQAAVCPLPE